MRAVCGLTVILALACGGDPAGDIATEAPGADPAVEQAVAVVKAHAGESIDPCDPSGWAFEALSELNTAVEARPVALDAIRAAEELAPLRSSDVYARWEAGAALDLGDAAATREWLAAQRWSSSDGVPASLILGPDGTFTLGRSGQADVSGSWSVPAARRVELGPLGGASVGRTNLGVWIDAGEVGFFTAGKVLCG